MVDFDDSNALWYSQDSFLLNNHLDEVTSRNEDDQLDESLRKANKMEEIQKNRIQVLEQSFQSFNLSLYIDERELLANQSKGSADMDLERTETDAEATTDLLARVIVPPPPPDSTVRPRIQPPQSPNQCRESGRPKLQSVVGPVRFDDWKKGGSWSRSNNNNFSCNNLVNCRAFETVSTIIPTFPFTLPPQILPPPTPIAMAPPSGSVDPLNIYRGLNLHFTEKWRVPADNFLRNKVVALFFGASFCPASIMFSRFLKRFYQTILKNTNRFEVVWIPFEQTAELVAQVHSAHFADWPYLRYGDVNIARLQRHLGVIRMPTLVITSDRGYVISYQAVGEVSVSEENPFELWTKWMDSPAFRMNVVCL